MMGSVVSLYEHIFQERPVLGMYNFNKLSGRESYRTMIPAKPQLNPIFRCGVPVCCRDPVVEPSVGPVSTAAQLPRNPANESPSPRSRRFPESPHFEIRTTI